MEILVEFWNLDTVQFLLNYLVSYWIKGPAWQGVVKNPESN